MSENIETQDTENMNEWINSIEDKNHIKFYEYKQLSNLQQIGVESFGNWRKLEKFFALKSFIDLDNITMKEIVREVL
jgi:hypothetical protein